MSNQVTGKIHVIGETVQVTDTFSKRELVIVTDEQYPQYLSIEFTGGKTELLDKYNVGDEVTVHINLRGREWTNPEGEVKYFNSIQGWRIEEVVDAVDPLS